LQTHLLIDANNCFHRHNFTSNLTLPTGEKISGVFGVFKEVTSLVAKYNPTNVVVVWDRGKSAKKLELYPDYKASRKEKNQEELENMIFQMKVVKELLNFLPIRQIAVKNIEADDVIGFLAKKLEGRKIIASTDTDFYQLINDSTIIVSSRKGIIQELDRKAINEKLGFNVEKYIIYKSLIGDSSDNIKGVSGIGKIKAIKYINKEPIKETVDKELLKRNYKLIKLAALLDKDDLLNIAQSYKNSRCIPNKILLRARLHKLQFHSILNNFEGITYGFRNLFKQYELNKVLTK
jgi:5'-3' exonuclease